MCKMVAREGTHCKFGGDTCIDFRRYRKKTRGGGGLEIATPRGARVKHFSPPPNKFGKGTAAARYG